MANSNEVKKQAKGAVDGILQKVNENENVKKLKAHKHYKWIKLGAVVLAVILVFVIIGGLFGDKNARKAEKYIKNDIVEAFEDADYKSVKVKTKVIGKNKDSDLYAVDTVIKAKDSDGEKEEVMMIFIIYSDGNEVYDVNSYAYEKGNKSDIKEVALAALAKG